MIQIVNEIPEFQGHNRFLSNFYIHPVIYDGRRWMSSEHAYQAAKAVIVEQREEIAMAPSPSIAKRLGSKVAKREDWIDVRVSVMKDVLEAKFSDPLLEIMLLSTGNLKLIEGNLHGDTFWGVDMRKRVGQNMLGRLLMQLREEKRSFA